MGIKGLKTCWIPAPEARAPALRTQHSARLGDARHAAASPLPRRRCRATAAAPPLPRRRCCATAATAAPPLPRRRCCAAAAPPPPRRHRCRATAAAPPLPHHTAAAAAAIATQHRRGGGTPEDLAPIQSPQCRRTSGRRALCSATSATHVEKRRGSHRIFHKSQITNHSLGLVREYIPRETWVNGPAVRLGTR